MATQSQTETIMTYEARYLPADKRHKKIEILRMNYTDAIGLVEQYKRQYGELS